MAYAFILKAVKSTAKHNALQQLLLNIKPANTQKATGASQVLCCNVHRLANCSPHNQAPHLAPPWSGPC